MKYLIYLIAGLIIVGGIYTGFIYLPRFNQQLAQISQPLNFSPLTCSECPVCSVYSECSICSPEIITKETIREIPKEIIKEVIKEVPVEKIVYQEKIIYQPITPQSEGISSMGMYKIVSANEDLIFQELVFLPLRDFLGIDYIINRGEWQHWQGMGHSCDFLNDYPSWPPQECKDNRKYNFFKSIDHWDRPLSERITLPANSEMFFGNTADFKIIAFRFIGKNSEKIINFEL